MRGLELVLGGLLVTSGLLGTVWVPDGGDAGLGNVVGVASFEALEYSGEASVGAEKAAVEVLGPVELILRASEAHVTYFDRTEIEVDIDEDGHDYRWLASGGSRSTESFEDVRIDVNGFDDGELQLWANESLGSTTFELDLSPGGFSSLIASVPPVNFEKDAEHRHTVSGPLYGLGHGIEQRRLTPVSPTTFEQLAIDGGLTMVVDNGTATLDTGDERRTYVAEDRWSHGDPRGNVNAREQTLLVLSLGGVNASFGFNDTVGTFFSQQPTLTVNGTVTFEATEGELQTNETKASLHDDAVQIEGRTELVLDPVEPENGTLDEIVGAPVGFQRLQRGSEYHTPSEATFQADADDVSVAGDELQVPSSSSSIPEAVSFWSKILGALLLAASVAKKLVPFVAPLAIDNPLDHDRRRRIFDFLSKTGMAHRRQIHRATGIPNASLAHHLRVLREHELVIEVERAGYKVYFPRSGDISLGDMEKLALLVHPSRRTIAERLVEWGEATQADLIEGASLSQSAVSKQLCRLTDNSLVEKHEEWPRRYRPTRLLRRWIEELGGTGTTADEEL